MIDTSCCGPVFRTTAFFVVQDGRSFPDFPRGRGIFLHGGGIFSPPDAENLVALLEEPIPPDDTAIEFQGYLE